VDEALAHAINRMVLEQERNSEFVPRKWYEQLWKDHQILGEICEDLRIRLKTGLGMWRTALILVLIYFLYEFLF
jgi:hypothetical protein